MSEESVGGPPPDVEGPHPQAQGGAHKTLIIQQPVSENSSQLRFTNLLIAGRVRFTIN